jgi:hypothetical protein
MDLWGVFFGCRPDEAIEQFDRLVSVHQSVETASAKAQCFVTDILEGPYGPWHRHRFEEEDEYELQESPRLNWSRGMEHVRVKKIEVLP